MPLVITALPAIQRFWLSEEFDPDQETYVDFRQARRGESEQREEMFAKVVHQYNDQEHGVIRREQNLNYRSQQAREVYLTMCACNIEISETPKAKAGTKKTEEAPEPVLRPLFLFKDYDGVPGLSMREQEFEKAWNSLPDQVAEELHTFCLQINPHWSNVAEEDDANF